MSDDRFKQARRSLIDRNKQRQQQQDRRGDDFADDDFHEDEKTLMVNVDELQGSGGRSSAPSGRSQPAGHSQQTPQRRNAGAHGPQSDDFGRSDDFADAATQMVDLNEMEGNSAPSQAQAPQVEERTAPHREAYSPQRSAPAAPPNQAPSGANRSNNGNQQVFAPGGGTGGYEGKTDFINVADFAQQNAEFAPDSQSAGYEGKTAFVHIDSLQGSQQQNPQTGAPQQAQGNIAGDQMLRQSYQFGPQSIQQGEVTLIFAQNPLGRQVVLRRVWAGNPSQMPPDVRQRIAQLDALEHPRLVKLNGVVATQTGLWADLEKPQGYRLSAVLEQHGPQDKENVVAWLKQVAEVLDELHGEELLYANLTPDAIWIQEDNSILLEPFDLLSFEKRGDLGAFGGPELKRPPSDRVLSPATDVYSLAAVAAAALTGLPFHPEKLANFDDQKLAKKLQAAMTANPNERPQAAAELAAQFGGGGFSLDGFSLDPAEIDIKIVAAIAVLLLGGFAGYMYWNQQQAQAAAQERARQAAIAGEQAPGEQTGGPGEQAPAGQESAGQESTGQESAEQAEGDNAVAAPGAVEPDSRINVVNSYRTNPPDEETKSELSEEEAIAEAEKLRAKAREHLEQADKLRSTSDKRSEYTDALEAITAAIRLGGDQPSDDDRKLLDELDDQQLVREYRKELRERVETALGDGAISDARRSYKRLYAIDYRASAVDFFHRNNNANVRTVHQPGDDADGNDD